MVSSDFLKTRVGISPSPTLILFANGNYKIRRNFFEKLHRQLFIPYLTVSASQDIGILLFLL